MLDRVMLSKGERDFCPEKMRRKRAITVTLDREERC